MQTEKTFYFKFSRRFFTCRVELNPQIGKRFERRLKIRQRRLSRKKKGSNNRKKAGKGDRVIVLALSSEFFDYISQEISLRGSIHDKQDRDCRRHQHSWNRSRSLYCNR